ncbi:hypothetical protein ACFU8Q_40095 [Streptomyces sp. NPDC057543]|uniref:hypothetical protein n=1 Tax=Streptomyces sp. NPDC057543 TaxID=3346163 RepID=UPI00369CEDB3
MWYPADPALLFDPGGRMFVIHEPALADELIGSVEEFFEGYDGRGRHICAYGQPGQVSLALASTEPQEQEVRARVERYYFVFAARHPTRVPRQETDLEISIRAVAEDWVEE